MYFKYIVIGAGLAGLTISERIANKLNEKVLLIEKRSVIGGNIFDYYDNNGILIHKYGPHIFHTNYKNVWDYLNNFTRWRNYQHKVLSYVDGNYVPMPITLDTINKLYNMNLSLDDYKKYLENIRVPKNEILHSKDVVINKVGLDLYNKFFKEYTKKQWGVYPEYLDKEVTSRIPIRYSRDNRYFTDKYQGIPSEGYTKMCLNMIENTNIKILLNTDYKEILHDLEYDYLICTAPVDYYFNYKYGVLKYRSIKFEFENFIEEDFQNSAVINYPNDYDFTRITEYKKITGQKSHTTTISKEYPCNSSEPCYPLLCEQSKVLLQKYNEEATKLKNVIFLGRLSEYKYYNMDQVIKSSLDAFKNLK